MSDCQTSFGHSYQGENDPSFIPEGAKAFKRDLPNAEIHFVPSGHFALESHHTEIAKLMIDFFHRKAIVSTSIAVGTEAEI